jgi:hypothetical protein
MKSVSELIQKDENGYIIVSCTTDLHLLTEVIKSKIGKQHNRDILIK